MHAEVLTYPTPGIKEAATGWPADREIIERDELYHFLQCALEMELTAVPPYLLALCSLRPDTNEAAARTLRGLVRDGMLRMTLLANVMNAVGCAPRLTGVTEDEEDPRRPRAAANAPTYPCVLPFPPDAGRPIVLRHFSPAAMRTFLALAGPSPAGGFPGVLRKGLVDLAAADERQRDQRRRLFPTDPGVQAARAARQVRPEHLAGAGGTVLQVSDLPSALAALDAVAGHDAGRAGGAARLREIYYGRGYGPYDLPGQVPAGEPVDVDWLAVYPVEVVDSDARRLQRPGPAGRHGAAEPGLRHKGERFNQVYARLLAQCHWAFNGFPYVLEHAAATMLELRYLGEQILRNPLPDADGKERLHACPTFEVTADDVTRHHDEVRARALALRSGHAGRDEPDGGAAREERNGDAGRDEPTVPLRR